MRDAGNESESQVVTTGRFKGNIFVSARMFTEQRFGPEAVERVLASMPKSERQILLETTILGWYPAGPALTYHRALDACFGSGDLALCVEAGRFSAGWALGTVLKLFLKLRSPHWLMEKSASVWGRYHDSGRWEFDAPEEKQMRGRLYDYAVRDPVLCARLRGFIMGAVELTGGQEPKVSERCCTARGNAYHEFHCTWR